MRHPNLKAPVHISEIPCIQKEKDEQTEEQSDRQTRTDGQTLKTIYDRQTDRQTRTDRQTLKNNL